MSLKHDQTCVIPSEGARHTKGLSILLEVKAKSCGLAGTQIWSASPPIQVCSSFSKGLASGRQDLLQLGATEAQSMLLYHLPVYFMTAELTIPWCHMLYENFPILLTG